MVAQRKYIFLTSVLCCIHFLVLAQVTKSKFDELVFLKTSFGTLVIQCYDETPLHKENFLKLAKSGFYNGTTFHRIIPEFMIQGGDPNSKDSIADNDGMGGPGYTIPNEIKANLSHQFGAVAAARMGDGVNPTKASSGSQFYIVQNKNGTPHLDNAYTVFGRVINGFDVINTIAVQPRNNRDRPLSNVVVSMQVKKMKRKKIAKKYQAI